MRKHWKIAAQDPVRLIQPATRILLTRHMILHIRMLVSYRLAHQGAHPAHCQLNKSAHSDCVSSLQDPVGLRTLQRHCRKRMKP